MSDFFFVNNTQKLTKESEIRKKKTYIIKIYNCYINFCLILSVKAFDLRLVLQPFIKSILYLFFFTLTLKSRRHVYSAISYSCIIMQSATVNFSNN